MKDYKLMWLVLGLAISLTWLYEADDTGKLPGKNWKCHNWTNNLQISA